MSHIRTPFLAFLLGVAVALIAYDLRAAEPAPLCVGPVAVEFDDAPKPELPGGWTIGDNDCNEDGRECSWVFYCKTEEEPTE